MKVLYVEDDPFDADLTQRSLQKSAPGIQLTIARTQAEAMEYLKHATNFDLLLTDLRLPDGSGFDLLSYVREKDFSVAVVVITGQGDEEIAVSALKAGADDYLVKRQDYLEHLAITLENAFQRRNAEVARKERSLRVLYLENNIMDVDLTRRHFSTHAPHIALDVVNTADEIFQRFPETEQFPEYDAIMLDYRLQEINALEMLKELRHLRSLDLPIILVTGHGDEEIAAQALRLGASDYVVKSSGYLYRLPGLLENAYHRAQLLREQAALRASEERFRRMAENAPDIIYRYRILPSPKMEYISPAATVILGYQPEEFYAQPDLVLKIVHPDDQKQLQDVIEKKHPQDAQSIIRFIRKDGTVVWIEGRRVPIYDANAELVAIEGIERDITERKRAEEHIERQLRRLNALRIVDTAITASLDLRVTLAVLLEHVITQLGVQAADVMLFNPNTQQLAYSAGTGFRTRTPETLRFRLGEGLTGKVALNRRTIHIPDQEVYEESGKDSEIMRSEEFVAYLGTPLIAKGQVKGVLELYHRSPMQPNPEWMSFFETLAGQAAIAIDNAEMFEGLQQANQELTLAYDSTLEGWVRALDLRDRETQGHTQRVTEATTRLARALGISEHSLRHIRRGALLHDIGKMGIPDSILYKPGPLNEEEWEIMCMHPTYAHDLLWPIDYLRRALDIPYCHHEKWDGTGYPQGLKGEQIPLAARIFAVVDVWDALSTDRPYRQGLKKEEVKDYIISQKGLHFDPNVVDKFLEIIRE